MIPADIELQLDDVEAIVRATYDVIRQNLRQRPPEAKRLLNQMEDDHVRRLRAEVRVKFLLADTLRKDAAEKPAGLTLIDGGRT